MKSKIQNSKIFLKKGYFVANLNNDQKKEIDKIKQDIFKIIVRLLKIKKNISIKKLFDNFDLYLSKKELNKIRLKIYNEINKKGFNLKYYKIFSEILDEIVGNEVVVQKKINFSIQLPKDDSSLLPIHSDAWAGDSPFEVVIWLPLVDCFKSKSMFILPQDKKLLEKLNNTIFKDNEDIFRKFKKKIKFIKINYGQVLIFSQNLPHGNIINSEKTTRWSFNCRVKSLFSPYSKKSLFDFFDPVKIKPATKIGLRYEYPKFKK